MAKAGYCEVCQANVWLQEDGSCQRGHAPQCISRPFEADVPPAPVGQTAAPAGGSNRTAIVVVAVALALVLACGLSVTAVSAIALWVIPAVSSQVDQSPSANGASEAPQPDAPITGEWKSRLATDYPGWRGVGFHVDAESAVTGPETTYTFTLLPPGRDFPVAVEYKSIGGGPALSQDEVLRSGAQYNQLASALLDYLEAYMVDKGRADLTVTSDQTGIVTVTWQGGDLEAGSQASEDSFDTLSFDEATGVWVGSHDQGD
jgi:hypothetical protein